MHTLPETLRNIRRPRAIIDAARHGITRYSRERHIAPILKTRKAWTDEDIVTALLREEEYLDATRRAGDANYSVRRHIHIMIALLSELHTLLRPRAVS